MFYLLLIMQVMIYCLTMYFFVKHEKTGKHKSTFRVLLFCLLLLSGTLLALTGTSTKIPFNVA